jgi:predicted TIM-barrel fold metal-dependent hydrolase
MIADDVGTTGESWVISADDHVVEPPNVWQDRLSARDRENGPRVVKDTCTTIKDPETRGIRFIRGGEGPLVDWWLYEDSALPIPTVVACAGLPRDQHTVEPIAYEDMRPGYYDPTARLADMDLAFVERSLCFPLFPGFGGRKFLQAKDRELARKCVYAYNDWMIEEWCGGSGGRLIPLTIVPLWDPQLAADEVRRNAARGCRAITFPEMPSYLGLPSIHDPGRQWDPLFEACSETGTVLAMHVGSGSRVAEVSPWAPQAAGTTLLFEPAMVSFIEWLVSGNLQRFPNLKILYSESQIGWIPYVLDRVDALWARAYGGIDPIVSQPPSSYLPGRVYASFFDDDAGIALRDRIGVSQIVFETDYPHQDSTWPDTPKLVQGLKSQLSPGEFDQITRTNALQMLGLT